MTLIGVEKWKVIDLWYDDRLKMFKIRFRLKFFGRKSFDKRIYQDRITEKKIGITL